MVGCCVQLCDSHVNKVSVSICQTCGWLLCVKLFHKHSHVNKACSAFVRQVVGFCVCICVTKKIILRVHLFDNHVNKAYDISVRQVVGFCACSCLTGTIM